MPLNVAQLTITVVVEDDAAQAALSRINDAYAAVAEKAMEAAAAQKGAIDGVTQALQEQASAAGGGLAASPVAQSITNISQAAQTALPSLAQMNAALAETANATQGTVAGASGATEALDGMSAISRIVAEQNEALAASEREVQTSLMGIGGGANSLMLVNQGLIASGQSIGPLNNGLMMMSIMLRQVTTDGNTLMQTLNGVAIALTAIGIASAAAGAPAQQAFQQFRNEVDQTGGSLSEYGGKVNDAKDRAAQLGFTQSDLYTGLATLTRGFGDTGKALDNVGLMEDLARAKNESLGQSAKDLIRIYEGYGRGVKELGIDMVFTHNAVAGLDAAQQHAAATAQTLWNAEMRLQDAEQRASMAAQQHALATDQVAQAMQRLQDAQQNVADVQARIAAQNAVPQLTQEAQATDRLTQARQNLADVQERLAIEAEKPIVSHYAEALQTLHDAAQQLQDDLAKIQDRMKETTVEHDQLAMAADRVAAAQEAMALASGGDVIRAQEALRTAISQQREELDRLHAKQQETLEEQQRIAHDRETIARDQAKLAPAAATDKYEADRREFEAQTALRDAYEQVVKAVQDVTRAKAQDAAQSNVRAVEQAQQMAAAYRQVRDAVEGVDQARRQAASQAIGAEGGGISVDAAQRAVAEAKKAADAAQAKLVEARQKAEAEANQGAVGLGKVADKVKGAAEAASQGWSGAFNEMKAKVVNFLGDFGNAGGRFLTLAFPFLFVANQLKGLFTGGGGGAEAATGGEIGAELGATGTEAGIALGPVLLVVAAIAALVGGFILAYQHIKPFREAVDDVGNFFKDTFIGAIHGVVDAWHGLTGAIGDLVNRGLKFFNDQVKIVNDFLHDHRKELEELGDAYGMVAGIVENVVGAIVGYFQDAWNKLQPIIHFMGPFAVGVLKGAWDLFKGIIQGVWTAVVSAFKIARDLILGIVGVFLDVITGHWSHALHDIWKTVVNVWNDIFDFLTQIWGIITDTIGSFALDIWNGFMDGINAGWSNVYSWFMNVPGYFEDFFVGAVTWLYNAGFDIFTGLSNGLDDMWNNIWNFFNGIWDAIAGPHGFFANVDTWLYNTGWNLLIGFWNGISDVWDDFWKWAKKVIGGFVSDVAGWLGLGSPSRIFRAMGQDTIKGFQLGMEDGYGDVHNSMSRFANSLVLGPLAATTNFRAAGAGLGGVGGGAVYAPQIHLEVHGSVMTERDLVDTVRNGLISNQARSGGTYMPGLTPR